MRSAFIGRSALALGILCACRLHAGIGVLTGDTYVNSASPTNNFGSVTLMNVGGTNSGLVQFDLSKVLSQLASSSNIPSTAAPYIGRATLTVFVNKVTVAGTLTAAPLLSSWSESTATYNTLPARGTNTSSVSVSASGQFAIIDVTNLVQGWLNNNNDPASASYVGGGNFGVYLSSSDTGVFVIDSKEGTATSHQAELDIDLAQNFTGVLKKNLTLSSPGFTSLMSIFLSGTETAGGRIFYTVRATDGGSQIATEEGVLQFLATANSITCTVQTTDKLHLGTVNSGCTPGFFNPGSHPGVSIFDNVTFSSPAPIVVHEVTFKIDTISNAVIRLEP
jgi:hypothetical protein